MSNRMEPPGSGWDRAFSAVERYGYGLSLAAALLWFARVDIIVPMVTSHTLFLEAMAESNKIIAETQVEIARNVAANNMLLLEIKRSIDDQQ